MPDLTATQAPAQVGVSGRRPKQQIVADIIRLHPLTGSHF